MKKILDVKNLSVALQNKQILKNINFCLYEKKTLAIIGESGCGKTTLALAIVKLLSNATYEGEIFLENEDFLKQDKVKTQTIYKNYLSIIFQDPLASLNPIMKIGKQIIEALKIQDEAKVLTLLSAVGIENAKQCYHQYPHEISGGMRQRVVIAIALAKNPKLIIADEPTASIDPIRKTKIIELFKEIQKQYASGILLITHDIELANNLADNFIVMYGGTIIEKTQNLYSAKHPYTILLLNCVPSIKKEKKLANISGLSSFCENGCAFADRCPLAISLCKTKKPPFFKVEHSEVACWLYNMPNATQNLQKLLDYAQSKEYNEIFSKN